MKTLLEASGAGAFVLIAAGWRMRAVVRRRRARRRPMALVLSDAIMMGCNPRAAEATIGGAPSPPAARHLTPAVGDLERLSGEEDRWGFSLRDADKDKVIFTFVYPDREKAQAALKAMRRARKDLVFAVPG